MYKLSEGQVFL